ncbi:MAG: uroporphyrinogen decarboxylase family protein, partial [Candidatus Bathyarchaeia archaeon]
MPTRSPSISWRENYLRTVEFREPEYIPCRITVMWPLWNTYREKLEEVALRHPLVFPGFKPGGVKYGVKPGVLRADRKVKDPFGCIWSFNIEGFQGQVIQHPLESWENFKYYEMPDPEDGVPVEGAEKPIPWNEVFSSLDKARAEGNLITAGMPHGFFFQRLYYLRGFTNLLRDFIQKPPQIYELIYRLTEFNLKLVDKFLEYGKIDVIYFGDDLGTQTRMPISPRTFREFIFPSYAKIFQKIRSRGIHVYLHTDGHVVEVLSQLMEAGA